jgi:type VI secretion system secreted protein Hcp
MAISVYLTVKGLKQGAFNGPVTDTGKAGTILVHSFDNEISIPLDPATGAPTGKRQHSPFRILKEIDQTSPKFWTALVNNETLSTCELDFWGPTPVGVQTRLYTISLTNAIIASVEESMLDDETTGNAGLPLQEEIAFTYQKITWTWVNGGITASDDWTTAT